MNSEEESLQALSRAVMTEARSAADQTLTEARQKAEAIRSESESKAAAARAGILENANKEAARIRSQAVASAHLKARTLQLERRETLLNQVFTRVMQDLPTVQQNGDFKSITAALLKEALGQLGSDSAIVQADPHSSELISRELLEPLSKELNLKLQMGEPLKEGTGVIVQTLDGHRRFDNTLETRLGRLQDSLRSPVYQVLMGGPK
jgi:vacuolar-type H+-ATPase subunit E/Vma4